MRRRIVTAGRPSSDPGCAGCPQLGTFRALRRAGLAVQGGLGCDASASTRFEPVPGRWAAVVGADAVRERGAALLDAAAVAGAALVVVADRRSPGAAELETVLEAAGVRPLRLDLADVREVEERVAGAAAGVRTAVVALSTCVRGAGRRAPLEVLASRCNRCGACLALGCPAIADEGEEAMAVDPGVCTGCALCVPLCRSRALRANAGIASLPYPLARAGAPTPGC